MSGLGLLGRSVRASVTGRYAAVRQELRTFHSYKSVILPGAMRPSAAADARQIVGEHFQAAQRVGMLNHVPGLLRLIIGPEFGFMGRRENGATVFDGAERIAPEVYTAAVIETQQRMRALPPGVLYVSPTAMIDTGTTIDGNPVVENRGFVVSSGPDGDVVEHTKRNPASIDNVGAGVIVQGAGPILVPIRDVLGTGITRYIAIAVCKDYADELVSGKITFPISCDLIVSPSAGWPGGLPPGRVDVLVNDSIHNPFSADLVQWNSGVWETTEAQPLLKGLVEALAVPDSPALCLSAALGLTSVTNAFLERYRQPQFTMNRLVYIDNAEPRCIVTHDRPLPRSDAGDSMMVQIVDATQGGDANIVTAGMTISQYEQLAARVAAIDADMPPELVTKPLDTVIDDSVAQVFDAMDNPADGPVDALIAQANTGALHEAVYQRLSDVVWEAVGSDERLSAIADEYGDTMLRVLADAAVAQPLRERLTQGGAGSSWVDSAVKRAVLNRRTHAIAENASDAQARAAQAAGQADALRNEVPARQQAIADSKAALERNPHDAGLAADLAHLEDQLHDLVAREMAAAEEAGAAEREREATQGALDQAREDAANADRQEQQEAERVFHGD